MGDKMLKNNWVKEILEWVLCFVIAYAIYLVINYLKIFGLNLN